MRSSRAFVGAATVVLSYPAAIAVQQLFGSGADTVIHLVTGTGFLVVAASMFDVDLPRWVNVVGAVAAGAFGLIFVLQGVADLTQLEWLRYLAHGFPFDDVADQESLAGRRRCSARCRSRCPDESDLPAHPSVLASWVPPHVANVGHRFSMTTNTNSTAAKRPVATIPGSNSET